MWKKAFVLLLSIDLLIVVAAAVLFAALPKAPPAHRAPTGTSEPVARIHLSMGQDAINSYLGVAVRDQADLQKLLSYAKVSFGSRWNIQFGLKVEGRMMAADLLVTPKIAHGNLGLQVDSASLGGIPIPPSLLMLTIRHAPLPSWITVDQSHRILNLNFSERPKSPYGVEVLGYNPKSKQLSVLLMIAPSVALPSHTSS